jgi:2-dehydropantoate 2-reductase
MFYHCGLTVGGVLLERKLSAAVIGAGAIGGITAAFLTQSGADVELVCKHGETADRINAEGLLVKGVRGEHRVRVKSVAAIEELSGPKDVVLFAVKAYDLPDAARRALPFLKPDSLAVSLQNGICTDALAEIVGKERTVGCVVGFGATMLDTAVLEMTSEGKFVIGTIAGDAKHRPEGLKELLRPVVPVRISGDIQSELYSKMIVNSCITSMGAMSGLTLGEMMKIKKARDIFLAIIREAVEVANALGLRLPPYGGRLDYYKLVSGKAPFKSHLVIRIVGVKYRRLKSSSLQSLQRGKPTEIDYFNGYIAQKGVALNIPTPINSAVTGIVKEIEAGRRKITPENFEEKAFMNA